MNNRTGNIIPDEQLNSIGMYDLIIRLFPICRSITGKGLRQTLDTIGQHIPITVDEVKSGTNVFDWTIPKEWNVKQAWIMNSRGEKIIDFADSNLHLLQYSEPVRTKLSLAQLKPYLHTLPDHVDWVPYRTSYYQQTWGFCMTHYQMESLAEDEYEVCIDSSLTEGSLTLGECFIKGESQNEILISCHCCHPSLANDNLSAVAVATQLATILSNHQTYYSYRFLFIPGTIGAIAWLARNSEMTDRIKHGLILANLGDDGNMTYKKSRIGTAIIDQAVELVLRAEDSNFSARDFSPYGYDERQFCSPGFNLPIGRLTRTPHGEYEEYHTSADNLNLVSDAQLEKSVKTCLRIINLLEINTVYVNMNQKCEPQLGKRGLYSLIGGHTDPGDFQMALLWMLNMSDGTNSLLDIAKRSDLNPEILHEAAQALKDKDLLQIKKS